MFVITVTFTHTHYLPLSTCSTNTWKVVNSVYESDGNNKHQDLKSNAPGCCIVVSTEDPLEAFKYIAAVSFLCLFS
jgi:hypothetical protein